MLVSLIISHGLWAALDLVSYAQEMLFTFVRLLQVTGEVALGEWVV